MTDLETLEKTIEARCQEIHRKIKSKSGVLVFTPTKDLQDEISALAWRLEGLKEALSIITDARADNPLLPTNPPEDVL